MSVAILGNIGSGKSELAESLAQALHWTCISEPVQQWLDTGFLKASYEDPGRYALPFQLYAFHTRCDSYRSRRIGTPYAYARVYDSHLVSDRAFMRTQFDLGHLNLKDVELYDKVCDRWKREIETPEPSLYIHLDLGPAACLRRIVEDRKRPEETGITLEYLTILERNYAHLTETLGQKVSHLDASASRERVLELATDACKRHFLLF